MRKLTLVLFTIVLLILSGCSSPAKQTPSATPLPMPTDDLPELPILLSFYRDLDAHPSPDTSTALIENSQFIYRKGKSNSELRYRVGFEDEVIADLHAKPGTYVEISFPKINNSISLAPEYSVFHFYSKRNWTLIHVYDIKGYYTSYWDCDDPGIYVRQWPALEGSEEYTRFSDMDSAIRFISHYMKL